MSPRTREDNQKIRDERREQLLRAALRVFARKGLQATRISDIAAEAGISQGLVHHYFESKEAIYHAVVERAMLGALQVTTETADPQASPWERLAAACAVQREGLQRSPEYLLVVLQCMLSEEVPSKTREMVLEYGQSIFTQTVELIRAGQAAGQIVPGDPRELALLYSATLQGLVLTQFTGRMLFENRVQPAGDQLPSVETILRGLKA